MSDHSPGFTMRQKIFSMNLGVETISLYLLCCAVVDAGGSITHDALADKWNGSRDSLVRELDRLVEKNILRRFDPGGTGQPTYQIVDEKNWN